MNEGTITIDIDHLSIEEKLKIYQYLQKNLEDTKYDIPVEIFNNKHLSALEAIKKYLREEFGLRFVKIANILNRSDKTIWTTYKSAKKNLPTKYYGRESKIRIPVGAFSDRKISVLENIIFFLKNREFSYDNIAKIMNRKYSTIVTVFNRAVKKKAIVKLKKNAK